MTLPPGPESIPAPSLCLIVLDGWGIAPPGPGNAISLARTPVYDELLASYPNTRLDACGRIEFTRIPARRYARSVVSGHVLVPPARRGLP